MKQINFQIEDVIYTEYKTVLFNENKTIAKDLRDYIQQRVKEHSNSDNKPKYEQDASQGLIAI